MAGSNTGSQLPPKIRLYWSKKEDSLMVNWETGAGKGNARHLLSVLSSEVIDELERRGFDKTTIRFQIRKKAP